jgi:hypothetical protein
MKQEGFTGQIFDILLKQNGITNKIFNRDNIDDFETILTILAYSFVIDKDRKFYSTIKKEFDKYEYDEEQRIMDKYDINTGFFHQDRSIIEKHPKINEITAEVDNILNYSICWGSSSVNNEHLPECSDELLDDDSLLAIIAIKHKSITFYKVDEDQKNIYNFRISFPFVIDGNNKDNKKLSIIIPILKKGLEKMEIKHVNSSINYWPYLIGGAVLGISIIAYYFI